MDKHCPIEHTMSLINGKWKIIILKELSHEPMRYGALERAIAPITPKVLIAQLREMEQDGLVIRTIFPEVPPRVEYALSAKGRSLYTVFVELRKWGLEQDDQNQVVCQQCAKCHLIYAPEAKPHASPQTSRL